MSRLLAMAVIVLLSAADADADAETAYVTDILRLGIHRASDTGDRAFESLISGTALEILDRNVNYAHVRMSDGREGWVKAAYLVSEKPAQLRVAEMEAELEALQTRVAAAEAASVEAERSAADVVRRVQRDERSATALRESLGRLERQNGEYATRLERYRLSLPLPWVAAALLLTLIGGFVGGWWWLDALIRRRHGGFRVY